MLHHPETVSYYENVRVEGWRSDYNRSDKVANKNYLNKYERV